MIGFELRTSGVESDRSANWATTTAHRFDRCLATQSLIHSKFDL